MISVVIPFCDAFDKLDKTVAALIANKGRYNDFEIVLFDNGSDKLYKYHRFERKVKFTYHREETNIGVLPVFERALEYCKGDIIMFIHSDVLVHGKDWPIRIKSAFRDDKKLGLLGFFGAKGIGADGGRAWSISNMQGSEWGKCDCHDIAAWHHGELIEGVHPAVVLDGLAMIFRSETLYGLISRTDAFAPWRAPHHFYDKILSLKTIKLGYHVSVIDIEFDHWSGATVNHSRKYDLLAKSWAKENKKYIAGEEGDRMVYLAAEEQMFKEFNGSLPVNVFGNHRYEWTGQ